MIETTWASRRASSRVASTEPAAVRVAVTNVPSMTATGEPVSGSKQQMTAWWVGRSRFSGKTLTSLVVNDADDGRYAGMAASNPCRGATSAAMRGGIEARPALRSIIAAATASTSRSRSRSNSTSAPERTSITPPHTNGNG